VSIRKLALRQQMDSPYQEFDPNDSTYAESARQFIFESKSDSHHTQAAFLKITPEASHIRPSHRAMSKSGGINLRGPKLMDDATATLLQRASNVGLELNASKVVLALTSAVAVFAFLVAGPLYGLLAALPAIIAALSYRVLRSLSDRTTASE